MKLAELIAKLAKKSGVDTNGEEFKKISIPDVEIPDEVATQLDQKLMNEAAAASNSAIRNKIKAEALNGIDALVDAIIEEDQLQGVDAVKNASTSYEKVKKLFGLQKDVHAQKLKDAVKPGKGDVDKEVYERQLADLNGQLKTLKQTLSDKETEFKNTREADLTGFDIQKILMGKEYALPKEMDHDLKLQTANAAVQKQLQAKGLKIIRTEQGTLAIVKTDGTPAYNESNEAIELNSFFDGALAQNKLLKVNDPADPNGGGKSPVHIPGQNIKTPAGYQDGLMQLDAMIAEASKG